MFKMHVVTHLNVNNKCKSIINRSIDNTFLYCMNLFVSENIQQNRGFNKKKLRVYNLGFFFVVYLKIISMVVIKNNNINH